MTTLGVSYLCTGMTSVGYEVCPCPSRYFDVRNGPNSVANCFRQQTQTEAAFLSFWALSDLANWKPNISVVRATIKYVISTGRLKSNVADQLGALRGSYGSQ